MYVYDCICMFFLQVIENTGAHVAFALKILNGMPFLFAQNLNHMKYIYKRQNKQNKYMYMCCKYMYPMHIYMYIYIHIHMKAFILNSFGSFMTRTPKLGGNLKETVYSSVYIVVYIQSFYIVVHIVVHVYIYMTGARMGSQRQPKRLQRTHETWAMCHLSGP